MHRLRHASGAFVGSVNSNRAPPPDLRRASMSAAMRANDRATDREAQPDAGDRALVVAALKLVEQPCRSRRSASPDHRHRRHAQKFAIRRSR